MPDLGNTLAAGEILVEVAYAEPERQVLMPLRIPQGSTAADAVRLSHMAEHFPQVDIANCPLGIFGRKVKAEQVLVEGDRVEIYRPLIADPKEVRRRRAELKTRDQEGPS